MRRYAFLLPLIVSGTLAAQTVEFKDVEAPGPAAFSETTTAPVEPKHGIEGVDVAPIDGSMATPVPLVQRRRMKRYDLQELTGSRQAIGPQLIDGRLPRPFADLISTSNGITQRISLFEGDLVIVRMTGAGGTMMKRMLLPRDATKAYLDALHPGALNSVRQDALTPPRDGRGATLRVYGEKGPVERTFDPSSSMPKALYDQVLPLQDLLRAISEDRTVSSTLSNYEPKQGDELVGDDRMVYRVTRVVSGSDVVELRCTTQPTILYIAKNDLYQYFVGRPPTQVNAR